jgi:hypothetical protein
VGVCWVAHQASEVAGLEARLRVALAQPPQPPAQAGSSRAPARAAARKPAIPAGARRTSAAAPELPLDDSAVTEVRACRRLSLVTLTS